MKKSKLLLILILVLDIFIIINPQKINNVNRIIFLNIDESQKKIENLNKATLYTTSFYITSILFAFLIKKIMEKSSNNF